MKKNIYLLACLGIICSLFQNLVIAGNTPGAFTVTAADAYYHFDKKRHIDNISMPDLAVAYNFTPHWAVEFAMGLINTDQRQTEEDEGVHGMLYLLDGIYRFTPFYHFEPYIIAGIGLMTLVPNGDDSEHLGNINAGIGTQLFWGPNVALRTEIRDIYDTTGESRNDYMINLGVSILFGGSTSKT